MIQINYILLIQDNFNLKRSDQVISRIRIGHSKLTHIHVYLLKGEQEPERLFCDCPLTVYRIFLECSDNFSAINLLLLNNVQSMLDLFTNVNINDTLQFLQDCDFITKFTDFTLLHLCFYVCERLDDDALNGASC